MNKFYPRFKQLLVPGKDKYLGNDGTSRLRDRNLDLKKLLTASAAVALEMSSPDAWLEMRLRRILITKFNIFYSIIPRNESMVI